MVSGWQARFCRTHLETAASSSNYAWDITRSATINTELGAVIASPELARELVRVIDIDRQQNAYRVRRRADGQGLEWVSMDKDKEMVLTEEPDSSLWLRLKLRLLSPFVPQSLL